MCGLIAYIAETRSSSNSSCSDSDSMSCGSVVAIACVTTFIVTLISASVITFAVTYIFVKKRLASIQQGTTGKHPMATIDTVVYETVGPSRQTITKMDLELQPNPAYGTSHEVTMDANPVYESCK